MELEESVQEGALRELKEEADAKTVDPVELLAVYSIPRHGQVHMFMRAALDESHVATNAPAADPTVRTCYSRGDGVETEEARLFAPVDIPWTELAFPITVAALKHHAAHPLGSRAAVDVQSFTPYLSPKK